MREVRFTLEDADVSHAARLSYRAVLTWRRLLGLTALMAGIWTGCIAVIDLLYGGPLDAAAMTWFTAAAFVVVPALHAVTFLIAPWWVRRQWRQMRAGHGEQVMRWDATEVEFSSPAFRSRFAWSLYYGWALDRHTLLLQQAERMVNAVPRRVLDEADLAAIVAGLRAAGVPGRRPFGRIRQSTQSSPIPR